jgi:hypothetical protein
MNLLESRVHRVADQMTILLAWLDMGDLEKAKAQAQAVVVNLYTIQTSVSSSGPYKP